MQGRMFSQTTSESSQVWDLMIYEIVFLSEIAKANGSLVSLKDMVTLTHTNLSEEQLKSAWVAIPELANFYELRNGLIREREHEYPKNGPGSLDWELEKRARAESYARYAKEFASLCSSRNTRLIAISGSTSYQTASASDDLDIFCITRPHCLWAFLTKSLLLARFLQLTRRNTPRICFSYAVDQNFAEKEFLPQRDALFARDALTTMVVHGQEFYRKLLKRSYWISNHFPRLYQQRTNTTHPEEVAEDQLASPPSRKFLNILLQVLVGNYIAFKSALLNRRLMKERRFGSLFSVNIGSDHCIFESVRYSKLRAKYLELNDISRPTQRGEAPPIGR